MYTSKLLLLVLACLVSFVLRGQEVEMQESDSVPGFIEPQKELEIQESAAEVQKDSVIHKKFLSGVEMKIDYGKLLLLWTNFESKYEVGINLRFKERIVLVTEYGQMTLDPLKAYDNTLYYTVKGSYGRIGFDYYTSYDLDNFYFIGVRYGRSMFEDEGLFILDSEYWEDYQEGFGSKDIDASWGELVLGTETFLKIGAKKKENPKTRFLLGWNASFRFLFDFQNREELPIYSIPGFGRTFNKVVPALNFYVKYRIGR